KGRRDIIDYGPRGSARANKSSHFPAKNGGWMGKLGKVDRGAKNERPGNRKRRPVTFGSLGLSTQDYDTRSSLLLSVKIRISEGVGLSAAGCGGGREGNRLRRNRRGGRLGFPKTPVPATPTK